MDLDTNLYASLTQEAKIQDFKETILALLAQSEDFDFRDKYTFGVISVKADGRNQEGSSDPDHQYFGIAILDDFTDTQKAETLKILFPDLSEAERVQKFDTTKVRVCTLSEEN